MHKYNSQKVMYYKKSFSDVPWKYYTKNMFRNAPLKDASAINNLLFLSRDICNFV